MNHQPQPQLYKDLNSPGQNLGEERPFGTTDEEHSLRRMGGMALPILVCFAFGFVFLALIAILSATTDYSVTLLCVLSGVIYLLVCGTFCLLWFLRDRRERAEAEEMIATANDTIHMFRSVINIPYALINNRGIVKVVNKPLQNLLGFPSPVCNVPLSDLCDLTGDALAAVAPQIDEIHAAGKLPGQALPLVGLNERTYELNPYRMNLRGQEYYFTVFDDVTAYIDLADRYKREDVAIAYIVLDNLEELAQYVRTSYRSATVEIEAMLKEWAVSIHALFREYDRDKFMLAFSHEELDKCIAHDFDILEAVRRVKLGDNSFPVTISMGVAMVPGTMEERERAASAALDVALQRGGDQVVLRRAEGITYFGGHVKPIQSNSSIMSRVNSNQFCALVKRAGNVLIMGHKNPDYDAIASAVGLARLAMCARTSEDCDVRVISDMSSPNFQTIRPLFDTLPGAARLFVDRETGLDMVRSNTLVVLADVNSVRIVEAPDVLQSVNDIAIIDHHRQVDVYSFTPVLSYIHASASSASELVTEMIEQSPYGDALRKEEAIVLLCGIMLDTKNFTHSAGAQTFAAVHYLYNHGAHTSVARMYFRENLDERLLISDLGSHAQIYRDCAITWLEVDHQIDNNDRIAIAKTADSMLSIQGVEASFALMKCLGGVIISARSVDKINVQLILEQLGGGGHFDMAGAQLTGTTLEEACYKLRDAIDHYYDSHHQSDAKKR